MTLTNHAICALCGLSEHGYADAQQIRDAIASARIYELCCEDFDSRAQPPDARCAACGGAGQTEITGAMT